MTFKIEKAFAKDVGKIRDRKLLKKLQAFILALEEASDIYHVPNLKKMESYDSFYRVKIGDYRLGMERISNKELVLVRLLHRKDIYRHFPTHR